MKRAVLGAACAAALASCTTGQSNVPPSITFTSSSPVLKFAIGTVTWPIPGVQGINVLETFRGTNGYTAIPINQAVLTGPAGFSGAPGSHDPGAGAPAVPLGSANNVFAVGSAGTITDLASADGFGVGPPGSSSTGLNAYPAQPQFADVAAAMLYPPPPAGVGAFPIYGGPPQYPPASLVSGINQFGPPVPTGWSEGFYLVALPAPAPAGSYTLTVSYSQNATQSTTSASATLNGTALPPIPSPTIVSNGAGGATVTNTMPPGTPVVETLVNVIDSPANPRACLPVIYTTLKLAPGASGTIANNLGTNGSPTFCPGDTLIATSYGFDYLDYELGPPGNTAQSPTLPAKADVTISIPSITTE